MKIQFRAVGVMPHDCYPLDQLTVESDATFVEGQSVVMPDGEELFVRTVVHFPWGHPEEERTEPGDQAPFTYVVVGKSRPS